MHFGFDVGEGRSASERLSELVADIKDAMAPLVLDWQRDGLEIGSRVLFVDVEERALRTTHPETGAEMDDPVISDAVVTGLDAVDAGWVRLKVDGTEDDYLLATVLGVISSDAEPAKDGSWIPAAKGDRNWIIRGHTLCYRPFVSVSIGAL